MACSSVDIPQWKKDLIARLKQSSKKNEERYWFDQHLPKHATVADLIIPPKNAENGVKTERKSSQDSNSSEEDLHYGPGIVNKLKNKYLSLALREASSRPTILRKATSLENLLDEDGGSDEKNGGGGRLFRSRGGETGPGSHLTRFSRHNNRQEMKRARSVETISRRLNSDSSLSPTSLLPPHLNNRQSLHEDMLLGTVGPFEILENVDSNKRPFTKMATPTENGTAEIESKYANRINRPKRIQPLLSEREKPPIDVVSKAKMIFEKRPETRTKKPPQTGDVAAKVEGFNSIIVKSKVSNCTASKKPPIKHAKPVLSDKQKNTHANHHRPVAKPVILNPDDVKVVSKPKTLDLGANQKDKDHHKWNRWESSLPSPIPDVSRVDQKNAENNHANTNNLCETPDLILTSSPVQMLHSPTFKRNSTEKFLRSEKAEATNRFISPPKSPSYQKSPQLNVTYTKMSPMESPRSSKFAGRNSPTKPSKSPVRSPILVSPRETFGSVKDSPVSPKIENKSFSPRDSPISSKNDFRAATPDNEEPSSPGIKLISPTSQKNISKNAVASSIFNFTSNGTSNINHLLPVNKNVLDMKVPLSEPLEIEINGHSEVNTSQTSEKHVNNKQKSDNKPINFENSDKNSVDFERISTSVVQPSPKISDIEKPFKTQHFELNSEKVNKKSYPTLNLETSIAEKILSDTATKNKIGNSENNISFDNSSDQENKLVFPKKLKPRVEESCQIFNFTKERRDVPDYISNDTSRTPQKPTLPQPGEGGIILIAGATMTSSFIDEDEEILRSLEGPPSPCDVTFINDNILIGGRSSFIKESRRSKMKISFIETTDIFEYPSEDSLLVMDSSNPLMDSPSQSVGHSVPMLSGSSLANYMPKTMEDFQLGITKSYHQTKPDVTSPSDVTDASNDMLHEETSHPSIFSNTTNADMLF